MAYKFDFSSTTIVENDVLRSTIFSSSEKLVYTILKSYMNHANRTAFPSLKTISLYTGLCKSTVQKAINGLEAKGVIGKKHRHLKNGGHTSNLYIFYNAKAMQIVTDTKEPEPEPVQLPDFPEPESRATESDTIVSCADGERCAYTDAEKPKKEIASPPPKKHWKALHNFSKKTAIDRKRQASERYSMKKVKEILGYQELITNHPDREKDIHAVFEILYETLNTTKPTMRILKEDKPTEIVIEKLLKLDPDDILYAINQYRSHSERIKNGKGYLLTILYCSKEQNHLDTINKNRKPPVTPAKTNKFNDYPHREYDFDAIKRNMFNQ